MPDELGKMLGIEATPLEEALQPEDIEEFDDEDLALISLGIDSTFKKIFYKAFPNKKIFRNDKFESKNLTKQFLDYCFDRMSYRQLQQIEHDDLSEKLKELVISARDSVVENTTKIDQLHEMLKWLYDFMGNNMEFVKEVSKEEIEMIEKIEEIVQ